MKDAAVVAAISHVAQEVLHRLWRLLGRQLHHDIAVVGLHSDFQARDRQRGDQHGQQPEFFHHQTPAPFG